MRSWSTTGAAGWIALVCFLGGSGRDVPDTALDFLTPLRGASGSVQAVFSAGALLLPRMPSERTTVLFESDGEEVPAHALVDPGIYAIRVQVGDSRREAENFRLIRLVEFSQKREGRIGGYEMGFWPHEGEKPPRQGAYAVPAGFVEVTRSNRSVHVSKHFKLEDFLTHGQDQVWPKYLVLDARLLDKLELIIQELKSAKLNVDEVHVMSGFRTPVYNERGGDPRGRGELSRHIYGDAADIWVDSDRDGRMDDLNGDQRIDIADSEVIIAAAERVEARNPSLVGGLAPYPACCNHGPFAHVDVRGSRARWRGSHP